MILRPAECRDAVAVAQIDNAGFAEGWSVDYFQDEIDNPIARLIVAEESAKIYGFLLLWLMPPQAELLRMAVTPERRRTGIAARLLSNMFDLLERENVHEVFLEVRRSNQAARNLYGKAGFQDCGMRPNYYRNPEEDAICMVWRQRR
ncbi:MAG: ribosomal protein S18-alanine N-acetyltransferase [Acidobacteriota bacterium]|jgi:ribosomal-protein-alanine N-acetyltransferase|nr:ribosomal protein S18-alanine N-acetyltransferase [Acidobacteriota bacterium]